MPAPLRDWAAIRQAQAHIDRDPDAAVRAAREAVRRDPLNAAAASTLGMALQAKGDAPGARAAFLVAARLGWRDVPTQLYWLEDAALAGRPRPAAQRLDALLRLGLAGPEITEVIEWLESEPQGRAALVERLAANPEWVTRYAGSMAALDPAGRARRAQVVLAGAAAGAKVQCGGLASAVNGMADRNDVAVVADLWFRLCRPGGRGARLFNGDFDQATAQRDPFDWQLLPTGAMDARIAVAPAPLAGAAAFAKTIGSSTAPFIMQKVLLPPGRYRLDWRSVDELGRASSLVRPSLRCLDAAAPAVEKLRFDRDRGSADLVIPAGCPVQVVQFALWPSDSPDQYGVWLDDVAIAPAGRSATR